MKHSEKIAPVAAVLSLFTTLACCLPLGIAAAAGAAGLSVVLASLRPWLVGLSIALLALGLWQLYRTRGACQRRSRMSLAVFWLSAMLVLALMLFPQAVAGFLADRLPDFTGSGKTRLEELGGLDCLKNEFNRTSARTRIIVLLSPT